jgi:hypothetical protein
MPHNFTVIDEKLDNIKNQVIEIKEQINHLHTKMFVGNGQKAIITRLDSIESEVELLTEHKNRVIGHIWAVFGTVGTGICVVVGWLFSKGFLKWMVENP